MLELISLDDLVLLQNFESVALASVFLYNKQYLSVRALPDNSYSMEVFSSNFPCFCLRSVYNCLVIFDFRLGVYL